MGTGPVALVILDGWGISESCENNAACQAKTPVLDALRETYPVSRLSASGGDVGLPDGQMGNSEVGHMNIGAGRIIYQDLSRISLAIADGSIFDNPALKSLYQQLAASGGKLHLLGLLSDGGVHSHNTHLYALIRMAQKLGVKDVCIHAFLDGRDTPPKSAGGYLQQLETELKQIGLGRVVTITGRYWAMDRDNRWQRIEKCYLAMTQGVGQSADSSATAIEAAYAANQTDEFVEPWVVSQAGDINDGDGIICFNFRSDRVREITRALTSKDFDGFHRNKIPRLVDYVCLTEYDETFDLPVAFPSEVYPDILAEVVSKAGLKQLRIAETEKYAHVTFFFNGGVEKPWPGEDRVLVPSPQDVATYDQKPAMSAVEVTDKVVARVESGEYQLIILNFANCDMVGHTGVLSAAIEAVEAVDSCLGRVVASVVQAGGQLLITADHGNCEQMVDANGHPHTAHTTNLVPCIYVDPKHKDRPLHDGILADLAPTILELLGLEQPAAMTGKSLFIS
ncbi:phosphoglycerate mutase [Desulfuromusa kysingii]|uniref:2,3-bisphosphoglycerate-independent phosphoglycerate mutase n=1 Tax=Desulfuromusa kysingii TaxID=37625 RepID=A0A1H4CJL7_9BACT|nr:2,3-bisphosphoglycerate-independent phosphoglycerate mutase [Desulfuromusa kysingii]SEA60529.1 phosphoglycerate mutase [Desulfuromusa kysingii]